MRLQLRLVPLFLLVLVAGAAPRSAAARGSFDKRAVAAVGKAFFRARPATCFETWDFERRSALIADAEALGGIEEGELEDVLDVLWKEVKRAAPRVDEAIDTPYGEATWVQAGRGGPRSGLIIGLHGGGPGAGDAKEPAGTWTLPGHLRMYPQGIRLVDDTWNTVHGEAFVLTLIEIAKARYEIDPDRVYVAGFSMGGTGSWHMAGRHPDLFAGAVPAHGVFMALPKSQLTDPDDVERLQHGLVPNVRNLAVYFYTGSVDKNCEPGTFRYVARMLDDLRAADEGGYAKVRFTLHEGVAHTYPPGEPGDGLDYVKAERRDTFPETLVWEYVSDPFPLPGSDDPIRRCEKHWFHWLHCARPEDAMHVRAVRSGNTIDLELTRTFPDDFTIYLNPSMIDVEEEVVVRVGGKVHYRGRPRPDVVTVLESLDAKLDRRMVFDRRIRVPEAPLEEETAGGSPPP